MIELQEKSQNIPIGTLQKLIKQSSETNEIVDICQTLLQKIEQISKSQEIDTLNIPNVKWDDVGGLSHAKKEIISTIMLPSTSPDLFDDFVKPRTGILFFGPPGTGKTMLAKCVATECKMNFLSVKGPELLNMYIGESEKNIREIFEKAKRNTPCVVFFDELDALAPNRGQNKLKFNIQRQGSDSSMVMDRMVAQFLTELDNLDFRKGLVFIIGATNRPDLLDQSLLRPGRFDKMIYLGINEDPEQRMKILQAQTRHLNISPEVNFNQIIEQLPPNFTGADFYGLTSQSLIKAAKRKINVLEQQFQEQKKLKSNLDFNTFIQEMLSQDQTLKQIVISQDDFIETLETITPSVSLQELEKYRELREKFT